jgi:ligand-binding sensor domain-containing protein/signal transduction histidine kinase
MAAMLSSGNTVRGADFTVKAWNEGLPSEAVISLTQSRDGYLWLGTFNGLARFDGMRFRKFDEEELPGLSSGPVSFLFFDSRGNLWAGADDAGPLLVKDGRVRSLNIGARSREGRLVGACEETNGTVWLATANGELCRYRDGQIGQMDQWARPEFLGCRGLMLDKSGWLLFGTYTGLLMLDPTAVVSNKELPLKGSHGRVDYLLPSRVGGFWLMANGQVRKCRIENSELVEVLNFGAYPWGTNRLVTSACEDLEGNLIAGADYGGVTWFGAHGRSITITSAENGLTHDTPLALLMDREGDLWVGTDGGGLNRIKRQVFRVVPESRGTTVQSVCEDPEGGLWFAPNGPHLNLLRNGAFRTFGQPAEFNIRSVFVDRDRKVWIGTIGNGLLQLDGEMFRRAPQFQQLPRDISAIYQDRAGVLWVGGRYGLARWNDGAWKVYTTANGLAGANVTAIADDADGNLWVGTDSGLNRLRVESLTAFHQKDGLVGDSVSALLVDSSNGLWIGTRNRGLSRFADGTFLRLSKREGLASDKVNYLAEDALGGLWIGSSEGLMHIEKSVLRGFVKRPSEKVRCRIYGSADGLQSGEGSSGSQPAACRGRDGTMWFPTTRGLVAVSPKDIVHNTNQPPVIIESVLVDDELQNTNLIHANLPTEIRIPAGKERLEIRYTSLNLAAPDRARFRYQLENHEKGWTEGETRVAHFSNLTPGPYQFHVMACNEDGVWNENGASLAIVVEPPFWRTWWFLTLSGLALLGAIVGTVHFISTQKLQRQLALMRQQEALERERARIARDLHDQLGANLTQISLLGEMAETDKDLPEEIESHAKQISTTARTTAAALDEIVWATNPSNDTLEGLVTYACKYAQEYFALAGVTYRIESPPRLPATPIPPDVRHNVFLAFKESVNNVVKHAQATAAKVRVLHDEQQFILEIEDNGRGLPADATEKGRNGLRNMRKRMEDVGGEFAVVPAPERGTLVRLTAPLSKKRTVAQNES